MKIKVQYKINTPQVEKEQQKQLSEKIKNAIRFFTNDIQYKTLVNKNSCGVVRIDTENINSNKRKINEQQTSITITVPVIANSKNLLKEANQSKLKNSLYKYIDSEFESKIIGFVESLEVIEENDIL